MIATMMLNALRATTVRLIVPYIGAWQADVDVDLDLPVAPIGPATVTIGTTTLVGTVDDAASGAKGHKASVRVVAGAGGWQKTVAARHFESPGTLLSTAVLSATAAEVLERVVDSSPSVLGQHYVRTAGPASRVLDGLSWYVDFTGTTIVGPRLPIPALPTVEILDWEPHSQAVTFASDDIVLPGTILVDPKFGTVTVRDVEQTFRANGTRGTAWCGAKTPAKAGTKLAQALGALARESVRDVYLRPHRYRFVQLAPDGKRLILQAVNPKSGVPDLVPCAFWPSTAGVTATFAPGTVVVVQFLDGDPSFPVVTHVEAGTTPIKVDVGNGTRSVACAAEIVTWMTAVAAACAANVPTIVIPPPPALASLNLFTD